MMETLARTPGCKRSDTYFRVFGCTSLDMRQLRRRLLSALAQGEMEVTLDLSHFAKLEIPVLRGLISLLRSVREYGADITLVVAHHEVRRTLAITGLDKVFAVRQFREATSAGSHR